MRTTEERIRLVRKRTAQLKKEKREKRQRLATALSAAACLALIVSIGVWMSSVMSGQTSEGNAALHVSGAASLFSSNAVLSYIIMGILAFFLGVCVTILLYRLRFREERRRQEKQEDPDNEF